MKSHSTGLALEPLGVRPAKAAQMLDCGRTRIYELLDAGELDSYEDGGRKVVVESIKQYVKRKMGK